MKIIHTSDIHIDSPLSSRLTQSKVKERRSELRSCLGRMISDAERIGAKAIIIAGDLFDEGRISARTAAYALDIIGGAKDISFFYLEGNHEGDALRGAGQALPENLFFFGEDWTYFALDGVTIAGRSRACAKMFDSLEFSSDTKNITVLHGELRDGRCADGVIGLRDARDRGIDYLALGHYHSYSETKLSDGAVAVYSGTPEGRGFDETGEKGYVIIDTDEKELKYEFVPFAKRNLHIFDVDITDIKRTSDIDERVAQALEYVPTKDLVRVNLVGGYSPELWKDIEGICRKFDNRFYYFEVKDSSHPKINPDDYKYDRSLKGEFIRTVMADDSLDDGMKARIISCGINALMGEELFGE